MSTETDMLMKLGERVAVLETRLQIVESATAKSNVQLDKLLEAATLGRGAWWMLVKIGFVLSLIFTFATTWWHVVLGWLKYLIHR